MPEGGRTALLVVLLFAVVGGAAGLLWHAVWTPPSGLAYQHRFVLDGEGLPRDFSGTGLFVLIGVLAGLVLAVLVALLSAADELLLLAALLVGGAVASYLMWQVGTLLGPPDPVGVARSAADFDPIPGDLRVHGWAAYLSFPVGAMLGAVLVFLLDRRPSRSTPVHTEVRPGMN